MKKYMLLLLASCLLNGTNNAMQTVKKSKKARSYFEQITIPDHVTQTSDVFCEAIETLKNQGDEKAEKLVVKAIALAALPFLLRTVLPVIQDQTTYYSYQNNTLPSNTSYPDYVYQSIEENEANHVRSAYDCNRYLVDPCAWYYNSTNPNHACTYSYWYDKNSSKKQILEFCRKKQGNWISDGIHYLREKMMSKVIEK